MITIKQLEHILDSGSNSFDHFTEKETGKIIDVWQDIEDKIKNGEGLHKIESDFTELIKMAFKYGRNIGFNQGYSKATEYLK